MVSLQLFRRPTREQRDEVLAKASKCVRIGAPAPPCLHILLSGAAAFALHSKRAFFDSNPPSDPTSCLPFPLNPPTHLLPLSLSLARRAGFNYDAKCKTKKLDDDEEVMALKGQGYRICRRKVQLGEGWRTYRKAKSKMNEWR